MSRGMCAADADEVPLPRPERGPLFFRYPLPPAILEDCLSAPAARAVPFPPDAGAELPMPFVPAAIAPHPSALRPGIRPALPLCPPP